jgi:zinc transporter ZupT
VAGAATVAAENVVEGFIVAVASGTGLGCGIVTENDALPGRTAVADITLCRGSDVSCRLVADMATAARSLHFVMVRRHYRGPGIGSLQVAGATTVGAEDVVEGFIVAVARGTGLGRGAVIENGGLPGRITVADITLCRGGDVSR